MNKVNLKDKIIVAKAGFNKNKKCKFYYKYNMKDICIEFEQKYKYKSMYLNVTIKDTYDKIISKGYIDLFLFVKQFNSSIENNISIDIPLWNPKIILSIRYYKESKTFSLYINLDGFEYADIDIDGLNKTHMMTISNELSILRNNYCTLLYRYFTYYELGTKLYRLFYKQKHN